MLKQNASIYSAKSQKVQDGCLLDLSGCHMLGFQYREASL